MNLSIPDNLSGIVNLNFNNLDGNEFAKSSIPIIIHENKKIDPVIGRDSVMMH